MILTKFYRDLNEALMFLEDIRSVNPVSFIIWWHGFDCKDIENTFPLTSTICPYQEIYRAIRPNHIQGLIQTEIWKLESNL